jgi:hypothetical protein
MADGCDSGLPEFAVEYQSAVFDERGENKKALDFVG